jgi:hypothetical protein
VNFDVRRQVESHRLNRTLPSNPAERVNRYLTLVPPPFPASIVATTYMADGLMGSSANPSPIWTLSGIMSGTHSDECVAGGCEGKMVSRDRDKD